MRLLEDDAPKEVPKHHWRTMVCLGVVVACGFILAVAARFIGDVATAAMFALPLVMMGIMIWRTATVRCPSCAKKMAKGRTIDVIHKRPHLGRHHVSSYSLFACAGCGEEWRAPAITLCEDSMSPQEYEKFREQKNQI